MRRPVLAIMDSEPGYAVRFMDRVNQKNTVPFEICAFTDRERLRQSLERRPAEILLIAEKDADGEMENLPAGQIILLGERPADGGHTSGGLRDEGQDGADGIPKVSKYQASSAILREVMEVYSRADSDSVRSENGTLLKPKMKAIGIFSPVGRSGKTALAMTLGRFIARKKPAVLINMETCPGLTGLLHTDPSRSISDVIYYIRQGEKNLMARILPLIREFRGLGYLPPFESAAELFGVTPEEWRILFAAFRTDSTYEALVLDMGEIPLLMPELLEECDVIYMPYPGNDMPAEAKTAEFAKLLRASAFAKVRGRIRRLRIPADPLPSHGDWFEAMAYGPVGRCAEECIERERL